MAASALRVYLRRDLLNASSQVKQNRFFFLPVASLRPSFPMEPITPRIPGNDSRTLTGLDQVATSATYRKGFNFGFNIGKQQLQFSVEGVFQPLDAADYPSLPSSTADYMAIQNALAEAVTGNGQPFPSLIAKPRVYEIGTSPGATEVDTATAIATTARAMRQRFLEWVADQTRTDKYANFRLGIRDWHTDGLYVEWSGYVTNPTPGAENAGFHEQYEYSFNFLVCDTIEVFTTGGA